VTFNFNTNAKEANRTTSSVGFLYIILANITHECFALAMDALADSLPGHPSYRAANVVVPGNLEQPPDHLSPMLYQNRTD